MEIAMFRYEDGEISDQLISLVHPHREVQKYVQKMTGITPNMLKRAPRFHEIAKRILEMCRDSILVGHNVEFDYRMLRQEFGRLGYPFEMSTLDTITLSRELLPGLKTYGLDAVCREVGIYNPQQHRAEGDARATLELFQLLQEKDRKKEISILGQSVLENTAMGDKVRDLRRSVKVNKGIYYLHDKKGVLLFMDTSTSIKKELDKLFLADNSLADKLRKEVHSVKSEATGNWLVAHIKLREEARNATPKYGEQDFHAFTHYISYDGKGSDSSFAVKELGEKKDNRLLLKCRSARTAMKAIRLHRRIKSEDKKKDILEILAQLPQSAIFKARGRKPSENCALIVEEGKLTAYNFYALNEQIHRKEHLSHTRVNIDPDPDYTELLKLGIFTGEFEQIA